MKKTIFILSIVMSVFVVKAFAELKEVRGVQTRAVSYYEDNENKWGFEFKNENDYPVWLEMELHTYGYVIRYNERPEITEGVKDTKSITLKAGETYVWKCDSKMRYFGESFHSKYYVTYKAYKTE